MLHQIAYFSWSLFFSDAKYNKFILYLWFREYTTIYVTYSKIRLEEPTRAHT